MLDELTLSQTVMISRYRWRLIVTQLKKIKRSPQIR